MFEHEDILETLNKNIPLTDKLSSIHQVIKSRIDMISRIAVALYESKTDILKTYIHSTDGENPLQHYEDKLSNLTSLNEILNQGRPRVIQDLAVFKDSEKKHSHEIAKLGFHASYTMPMYHNGTFFGFLFFNSYEKDCFTHEILHVLDIFGHLIALTIINEMTSIRTMLATVRAARQFAHHRDVETGAHIDRMAHYCLIIAEEISEKYSLTDEYIEHLFLFSPLHDIGKIGIPDKVLLKPDKLNPQEKEIMKNHAEIGGEIIQAIISDFGLNNILHTNILINIAKHHHEAIDGSGYPHGLKGDEIPIESRITSVADVFDALTSKRPYKDAWSNEDAIAMLQRMAGDKLDKDCVDALVKNYNKIIAVQTKFKEDSYG